MSENLDLASLLLPTSVQAFLQANWSRGPFIGRTDRPDRFDGLLDIAEFEFLLSTVAAPGWVSFVKDTVKPPSREQLTSDGTLHANAIYRGIADQQSLLLTRVHRLHAKTGALCRRVTADFRAAGVTLRKSVRANAYFTPPRSQGFAAHYDDHDVLVLQLHGKKQWRVHGEAVRWPRKPMADALSLNFPGANAQDITLQPGDVLYLPRGFAHEAKATEDASLHLTLSVEAATWSDVFERLIEMDDRFGEPLPLGFCSNGGPASPDQSRAADFRNTVIQSPGLDQAMVDVFNRTLGEGDFPPNGHLARIGPEAGLGPQTWLVASPDLFARLEQRVGVAILRVAGATLRADQQAAPLFKSVCEGRAFRLADLGPGAAELVDLARELISRGVLTVLSGPPPKP